MRGDVIIKPDSSNIQERATNFLKKIYPLLATSDCQFQINEKNILFDREYPLTHKDKIKILKNLSGEDCIKVEPNTNSRYSSIAEVFVFIKSASIYQYGEKQNVEMYIKMYVEKRDFHDLVIVISFHKEGEFE